jgi:tRNA (guanine-N7-)-methyltransferase
MIKNNNKDEKAKRPIRSFVRRQGRLSDKQAYALNHLWEKYGLALAQTELDFSALFGRVAPCILEIGFGMGQSFIAQAQQNPGLNYIGIEVHKPGIANVLAAIEKQNITNIRLFDADAVEVLQHCIPANSLTAVQLFFPDPWPKRRHHKRRLVQPAFVELIRQKLIVGGKFHLATDWQDYAVQMMEVLSVAPGFVNAIAPQQYASRPEERPLTKFELRGQRLGHEVFDLLFVKE